MGGDAIGDYLDHLAVERRMSPNTLDGYRRDLAALQAWAEARSQALAGLGGEDIRFHDGLVSAVVDGVEVTILPAVAGGIHL